MSGLSKVIRRKYKGTFIYAGEEHILYRYAVSEFHAFTIFMRALASDLGLMYSWKVRNYFEERRNAWKIERVVQDSTQLSKESASLEH